MIGMLIKRIREAVEIEQFRTDSAVRFAPSDVLSDKGVKVLTLSFVDVSKSDDKFVYPRVVKLKGGKFTAPLVAIPSIYTSSVMQGVEGKLRGFTYKEMIALKNSLKDNLSEFFKIEDSVDFLRKIISVGGGTETKTVNDFIQETIKYFFSSTTSLLMLDLMHPARDIFNYILKIDENTGQFIFVFKGNAPKKEDLLSAFTDFSNRASKIRSHWAKFPGNYFIASDFARILFKFPSHTQPSPKPSSPQPPTSSSQQATQDDVFSGFRSAISRSARRDRSPSPAPKPQTTTKVETQTTGYISLFDILRKAKLYYPKKDIDIVYNTPTIDSSNLLPVEEDVSLLSLINDYFVSYASKGLCAHPFTQDEALVFSLEEAKQTITQMCNLIFDSNIDENYYSDFESTVLELTYRYKQDTQAISEEDKKGVFGFPIVRKYLSEADLENDELYKKLELKVDDGWVLRNDPKLDKFKQGFKKLVEKEFKGYDFDFNFSALRDLIRMPYYFLRLLAVRGGFDLNHLGYIDQYGAGDPTSPEFFKSAASSEEKLKEREKVIKETIRRNIFEFYDLFLNDFVPVVSLMSDYEHVLKYFSFLGKMIRAEGEFSALPQDEVRRIIKKALMLIDENGAEVDIDKVAKAVEDDVSLFIYNFNNNLLRDYDPYNGTGAYDGMWYVIVTFYENFVAGERVQGQKGGVTTKQQEWLQAKDFKSIFLKFKEKADRLVLFDEQKWKDILLKIATRAIFLFEFANTFVFESFEKNESGEIVFPEYKHIEDMLEDFNKIFQEAYETGDFSIFRNPQNKNKDDDSQKTSDTLIDVLFNYGIVPYAISNYTVVFSKNIDTTEKNLEEMLYEHRSGFIGATKMSSDHTRVVKVI